MRLFVFLLVVLAVGKKSETSDSRGKVTGEKKDKNRIDIETDYLSVRIVGNKKSPFFFFWNTQEEAGKKYKLMFHRIFEAEDVDKSGTYSKGDRIIKNSVVNLKSTEWTFTDPVTTEDNEIYFEMSADIGLLRTLILRNHIGAGERSYKFDVVFDGYRWRESGEDRLLVLWFTYKSTGGSTQNPEEEGEDIPKEDDSETGEADETYETMGAEVDATKFDCGAQEKATHENEEVPVRCTKRNENQFYLSYGYFGNGGLIHDPGFSVGHCLFGPACDPTQFYYAMMASMAVLFSLCAICMVKARKVRWWR